MESLSPRKRRPEIYLPKKKIKYLGHFSTKSNNFFNEKENFQSFILVSDQ